MIFLNVFYLLTFTSYKNFSFNFKYNNLTNIYSNTIYTKDYTYTCDDGYTRDSIHTRDYGYTTNGSKRDNKLNSKLGINYEDLMNNNELDEIRKEKKIKIPYFVEYPIDKVIDEPDITKEDLVKSILSELGFFSSSVTVTGPPNSTNYGTVGASTVTKGKGANSMPMECNSEKIWNEIAVVTNSRESGTFNENTEGVSEEAPFGAGTDGTTGREPHTVTGKDYLIKTSIIDKFDNMKNEMESSIISEEISPSLGKQRVRWFPNHISRSLSQLHYYLKMSDIILDVRDGRIPFISPDDYFFNLYEQEFPNKPRIIVFTHSDKLPKIAMSQWLKYYRIIFRNIYKSYVTGSSVTVSGPPNSTNRTKGTTSTSQTISPTNSTKDISTTGPSTVTEGKGANDTFSTPGKGANSTAIECTTEEAPFGVGCHEPDPVTGKNPMNRVMFVDAINGIKEIIYLKKHIFRMTRRINIKRIKKGLKPREIRVILMGMPNVGKSSLINRLIGKKITKSYNIPGITRNIQLYSQNTKNNTNKGINKGTNKGNKGMIGYKRLILIDTPGIVYNELKDEKRDEMMLLYSGLNLLNECGYELDEVTIILIKQILKTLLLNKNFIQYNFNNFIFLNSFFKKYSVTGSGPPNSTNNSTNSTTVTKGTTNTLTTSNGTTGASTVTEGKGANSTAMECTKGKGANFTAMECTMGKGANSTAMECNSSNIEDSKGVVGKRATSKEDPFWSGTEGTGAVGGTNTGVVGASTVTDDEIEFNISIILDKMSKWFFGNNLFNCCNKFLNDFRRGKLGKIMLQIPNFYYINFYNKNSNTRNYNSSRDYSGSTSTGSTRGIRGSTESRDIGSDSTGIVDSTRDIKLQYKRGLYEGW
ncbi:uncharacterized protein TA09340 [Theileria annulata]|uniref:G domain-containing protein n=1 Tax=Theileria annulata TaxID=5874 RepID=Q4UAD9_THEAN|nr:uncharacterized protein TA09340 [Theileria annulata]CAI76212.1 hypothetical protein, conserved [Theileria annulata]|eukprot:XP_952837.1 hypothetical protein, conserved [Theileria annulata]